MNNDPSKSWTVRLKKLHEEDSFDIDFWQKQDPGARYRATWELVEHYAKRKGIDLNELRLQRFTENFIRSGR